MRQEIDFTSADTTAGSTLQPADTVRAQAERLELAERRLAALLELGPSLIAERDPAALLRQVCVAARTLAPAAIAGIGILSDDGSQLRDAVTSGAGAASPDDLARAMRTSQNVRRVLESGRPLRGRNPGGDPTVFDLPADHPPIHSFLLAPLASRSRVYGCLALVGKIGADAFTELDERLAMSLGAQVAMAYENARLVAELLEQQKTLRDHEDDMEFAMSIARVGVSYRELDSNHILLSRSLASLLGLPPGTASITRDDFLARVHPDDADMVRTAVAEAVAGGSEFELEYRLHTPAGGWRWIRSNGRVTTNDQGRAPRLFSGLTDVTEHRLLEVQLRQSQKMEAMGQLAGGVAHDFNNLLTAICGYGQLLLLSCVDPEQQRNAQEIVDAADRAASLTKRLLTFSRREVTATAVFDLNVLVYDMAAMLKRIIGEDIELIASLGDGPLPVRADRGHLEQVVLNLVVNARDAISGGGTIRIETGAVRFDDQARSIGLNLKAGPHVTLTVRDSGCGMTEETKSRVFEPFFTTKSLGRGTGLGLATVYGIVAQANGAIGVASDLGVGSAFTVYLPRHQRLQADGGAATPAAPVAGGTETVLVAEDERAVRKLARIVLERAGYTVIEAANPAEARAIAAATPTIDLLLTDVIMPGGTGPELFRQLSTTRPDLRVVFMSGHAHRDIFERAGLDRDVAFIEKPFSADVLLARVSEALDV